jgi:AbrB family looped-hinge helix DNA binding protein
MMIAYSKVNTEGQISIPEEIRRKLRITPGSIIEWKQDGDQLILRKTKQYSSHQIHEALFPKRSPKPKTLEQLKKGISQKTKRAKAP